MPEFTLSVLHLGNVAELDTTDGNNVAENQNALLGTYRGGGDPASHHVTTITAQDDNSDGLINSNDQPSAEAVSFDLGSGTVNTVYDALFNVDVTVNFQPGSGEPPYTGLGGIIQTETGDLFFVMIDDDAGFGANSFDNVPIDSVTVNSISAFGSQQMPGASDSQSFVPCFSTGTLIQLHEGLKPVEQVKIGDLVATLDHGPQRVCWVGHRALSPMMLARHPHLRPIYIEASSLGAGYPNRDLIVSPQHRVLLRSKIIQRMTDEREILVAAVKLLGYPGVGQLHSGLGIQYHHIACEAHEVIEANGMLTETLFWGELTQQKINAQSYNELETLLPDTFGISQCTMPQPIRPIIKRRSLLENLLSRHLKNNVPLIAP